MGKITLAQWLWNLVSRSMPVLCVSLVGLAIALDLGLADDAYLGQLVWDTDFDPATDGDIHLWTLSFSPLATAKPGSAGLTFNFVRPGMTRAFTRSGSDGPLTSEITGAQIGGPPGAMVGLVFDYRSDRDYAAVMVNNNGYVMAYRQSGTTREEWFPLQQWPHVLLGSQGNRLRVDIMDGRALIRVNDEVLQSVPAEGTGSLGVIAISSAPGQEVLFVRSICWSRQQNPRDSGDSV